MSVPMANSPAISGPQKLFCFRREFFGNARTALHKTRPGADGSERKDGECDDFE
jgi:hypothetical protein